MTIVRRSWNWRIWAGFGLGLFAALSYVPLFARFAITRDFPWANLLFFAMALWLAGSGVSRAFRRPERYRGKIAGSILGALTLGLLGLFAFGTFYAAHSLPSGRAALATGQTAPDFELSDTEGKPVVLSHLLQSQRAVLLIFYRGYW